MSYSVKNALTRRNKEIIDEEKRSQYPYRVANKRVFEMEKKDIMDEIPRPQVSLETYQENSLLANKALIALDDLESNLNNATVYGDPRYLSDRLSTSPFLKTKEALAEYLNYLQFKVIPTINASRNINLISQNVGSIDKIYRKLQNVVSLFDDILKQQQLGSLYVDAGIAEGFEDEEEYKVNALYAIAKNEVNSFKELLQQFTALRQSLLSYTSTSSRVTDTSKYYTDKNKQELEEYAIDKAIREGRLVVDVDEPFAEDEELNELDYDPLQQQKNQFEDGERIYRDEQKQDEDDLEGMGLRFRLAKTKKKQR